MVLLIVFFPPRQRSKVFSGGCHGIEEIILVFPEIDNMSMYMFCFFCFFLFLNSQPQGLMVFSFQVLDIVLMVFSFQVLNM